MSWCNVVSSRRLINDLGAILVFDFFSLSTEDEFFDDDDDDDESEWSADWSSFPFFDVFDADVEDEVDDVDDDDGGCDGGGGGVDVWGWYSTHEDIVFELSCPLES